MKLGLVFQSDQNNFPENVLSIESDGSLSRNVENVRFLVMQFCKVPYLWFNAFIMKATLRDIEIILETLSKTPLILDTVRLHKQDGLYSHPKEKEWSAHEILGHLRACADVWGQSIEEMLKQDNTIIEDLHPRNWIRKTNYLEINFDVSLKAFTLQRNNLLKILKKLPVEKWESSAMIGSRKHTVFTQARRMAKHEQEHCLQIKEIF